MDSLKLIKHESISTEQMDIKIEEHQIKIEPLQYQQMINTEVIKCCDSRSSIMEYSNPSYPVDLQEIHIKKKSYECLHYGKSFTHKQRFEVHQMTHTGENPYQCDHCDKSFAHKSTLTMHKRTHTREKPYQCDHCDKSFARKSHLTVDQRTHTREKSFQCDHCDKCNSISGSNRLNLFGPIDRRKYITSKSPGWK